LFDIMFTEGYFVVYTDFKSGTTRRYDH